MKSTIGISDISLYIPKLSLDVETLVAERSKKHPRLARYLDRACKTTGQRAIRFPALWEDTSTMASEAAYRLIHNNPNLNLSSLRYLTVGTETSVDLSKPVSAYVGGMLQSAGLKLPETLSSFQVQHACAAGTLSLLSVSALLSMNQEAEEQGIVICSDIARYAVETTAEITQGAGSVALLVERNPRLIELDLDTQGYCSRDVDDFFRPLESKTPRVKGGYSMQCYVQNLEAAFLDHCKRRGEEPSKVLESTDFFVLHAPFKNMPDVAMQRFLNRFQCYGCDQAKEFLEKRGFYSGIEPVADIGNIYTGSVFLTLASLLNDQYNMLGEDIVGKNVLLASYGSGNTMVVLAGKVAPGAPEVLQRWDLANDLYKSTEAIMDEYKLWTSGPFERDVYESFLEKSDIIPESFYLAGIREDGYRVYGFNPSRRNRSSEGESFIDLHRSEPVFR
jgi:hydroxymethylglutaryl-CoA synthase